jgi:hypothetical protein
LPALIHHYAETYHVAPWEVEAALFDPAKADSFERTLEMWSLEAEHTPKRH